MAEAEQEGRGVTQVPTQNTLNAHFSKTLSNVDQMWQYMISGSKKAPQIGRARSIANSLTQLFDSIAFMVIHLWS